MAISYKVMSSYLGDIDLINDEATFRWELVCVVPLASEGLPGRAQYYFKRGE